MAKQPKRHIFIDNPAPNGKRYTVLKSALDYIARGLAEWSGADRIKFIERPQREQYLALHTAQSFASISGLVFWNGADTRIGVQHLPGTASVIPVVKVRIPVLNDQQP